MEKKPEYVLCPRCELNYFVFSKNQKYCTVCLAEMNKADPEILIPEEDDVELEILCPVCKANYMTSDEEMCFICSKEHSKKIDSHSDDFEDFVDDETVVEEEPIEISLSELEEEENTLVEDEDDDIFEDEENLDTEELIDEDYDDDDEDEDEDEFESLV